MGQEAASNESNESGDLEFQRGRSVIRLTVAERFNNLTDLKKFLLIKKVMILLGWNFHWLRWLVNLDLVVSHSLDALIENIGNLPSLRALNLPNALYSPSLLNVATRTVSRSNWCLEDSAKNPWAPNVHSSLVLLPGSDKEIHNPKLPKYEQLYMAEGFPELVSLKILGVRPGVLLPHNPLSRKRPPRDRIISISRLGKLEDVPIKAILKKCIESLKSGERLVIIVRRNLVSKELDRLDIILDEPSSINMLAFSLDGRDNILILAELPIGPFYLPKEVPLQRTKYSVFLVYHGPDVKESFIHHLFQSLRVGGVKAVNIDLNKWEIERGKYSDLEQGLDMTNIHIPIVSRHYEDSFSRHLREFLGICRSKCLIRPLFYEVEQTDIFDIRMLYKSYFSVAATPDSSSSSEINEASSSTNGGPQMSFQTGWSSSGYRSVKQLVRRVVLDNLLLVTNLPFHAVGLEEHMSDLTDILKMESDDLLTVGISGTGGIGKSALAKALFNRISFRFQAASFVAAVKRHEICEIQEQVLRDLIGQRIFVKSVEHGKALVKANAGSIRALVILDDINSLRQVEALSVDWLAPGSRVVLISQDDRLFSCGRTDVIYYIQKLSFSHGIELFSWHAFLREYPYYAYEGWCQRIVKVCQGIPLLLEIVGAFLYGNKNVRDWESSTKYLEDRIDQDIHRRLEFSYRGLNHYEKDIFLDIACFFNGTENMETAFRYWEISDIESTKRRALGNLVLKSLIWIDDQNKFVMHDHVQEMGRAIVASESPLLEKRTRIWKSEEAIHVTSRNLGTASTRSFSICRDEGSDTKVKAESLALMSNLMLLWMDGVTVEGDYRRISPNLKWLRWNSCPLKSFPSEWPTQHTVILDLGSVGGGPPTELHSLWDQESVSKQFVNLRVLLLNHAPYIKKLPDFSNLVSLTVLDLEKCYSLKKLPSSIRCLGALKWLNLSWCRNLVKLPQGIAKLSSLERLLLRHCSSLKELPSEIGGLMALKELDVGFSQLLEKLPSIKKLSNLENLDISGCWSIRVLPHGIGELDNLNELDMHSLVLIQKLPSLDKLSFLKRLVLNGCSDLIGLPSSIGKLQSLVYLDMNGCSSIRRLPEEIGDLVHLEKLYISKCHRLSTLPDSFGNLVNLTTLELKHNSNLMGLPSTFCGLQSLLCFDASNCNLLDGLPKQIEGLLKLQLLNLENNLFHELPSSFDELGCLTELNLSKCQSLETIPTLPKGLVKLDAGDCTQLKTINDMSHCRFLQILIICNCENLVRLPDLKSCQSLVMLNISRCRKVRSLAGAEGLSSLKTLYLSGSGVSVSELRQGIKDMPSLEEVNIYANEVPQWLECKKKDQYLHDEIFNDILFSPVNKTLKCRGVLLCFVLNFMYRFRDGGSPDPPQNCMKMSIEGDDGVPFWTTVFSNRQKVEGDQLYICLYGENHLLTSRLGNNDGLRVMAKGTNIQIKECGMQLLYNGIADRNLGRLEDDLSSSVSNYINKTVTDKVAANETDLAHKMVHEEDCDIYDYGYSTSEDGYSSTEDMIDQLCI